MRYISTAVMVLGLSSTLFANCDDLFFSEYIEGSSNNKAVEIYNPTASGIDLSTYSVEIYSNGASSAGSTLTLSGTLASGDVYVIANSSAVADIQNVADATSGVANYNGDDTLLLKHNGTLIDAFGKVGEDPGSAWSANGVSTQNQTLVRKSGVSNGDATADDAFDPFVEWDTYAIDTFSYLGSHSADGCAQAASSSSDASASSEAGSSSSSSVAAVSLIHDIQGSDDVSAMNGASVTIEAVVVGDFPGMSGYFVQEEDADIDADLNTSEGVLIYCSSVTCKATDVSVGDLVRVSGTVSEYYNMTEITSVTAVTVISSGNALPSPANIQLPVNALSDLEAFEGMRVTATAQQGSLSVAENYQLGRYGQITVASGGRPMQFTHNNTPDVSGYSAFLETLQKRTLLVDDGQSAQNPDPLIHPDGELSAANTLRSGYTIASISGCLNYAYNLYTIQPTESLSFGTSDNPREPAPQSVGGNLKVASFNVLNYFNTFSGCTGGVSGAAMDCRGAESAEEFTRQREKIINAMYAIDADIFGLMEMENDGYDAQSALADLVDGLNNLAGEGTYAYIDADTRTATTNALGTDAIKVALVYKPSVLTLGKTVAAYLDSVEKNRPTLIQTFIDIDTGEHVSVSVNHLKSKGSDCNSLSDPDVLDGQGNCNLTRTAAATELMSVIGTEYPDESNILVIGDLNAYAMEDPVTAIKNAGFRDLNKEFHGDASYSYVFNGQIGYLDHALATTALSGKISGISHWHINADEPSVLDYNENYKSATQISQYYDAGPFRSSDHDPVIIGINLSVVSGSSSSQSTSSEASSQSSSAQNSSDQSSSEGSSSSQNSSAGTGSNSSGSAQNSSEGASSSASGEHGYMHGKHAHLIYFMLM